MKPGLVHPPRQLESLDFGLLSSRALVLFLDGFNQQRDQIVVAHRFVAVGIRGDGFGEYGFDILGNDANLGCSEFIAPLLALRFPDLLVFLLRRVWSRGKNGLDVPGEMVQSVFIPAK